MKPFVFGAILAACLVFNSGGGTATWVAESGGGTGDVKADTLITDVHAKYEDSVFHVHVIMKDKKNGDHHGSGTAWYIGSGYFLTADHVVGKADIIELDNDTFEKIEVKRVWTDSKLDVSLLRAEDVDSVSDVPALKISTILPVIGEEVEAVGYPGGDGPYHIFGRVASRLMHNEKSHKRHADDGEVIDHDTFAVNMATIAGESGGPLFNLKGEIVGIMEAAFPVATPPYMYLPKDIAAKIPHSPPNGPMGLIVPSQAFVDKLPKEILTTSK